MLTDRRQLVLASLIEEYVARAMPVGSRTLTERYQLGVSPATVRNELSALEEEGLISQPHTSAGRIPTDFGYRAFVDRLIESGAIYDDDAHKSAVESLKSNASELDDLFERTNSVLARLTDCLSIVVAPSSLEVSVKQITVISLTERNAIVILVTTDGQVFNRHIDFGKPVTAEDLIEAQRVANRIFVGSATDLRDFEHEEFEFPNPVIRIVLDEVINCLREQGHTRLFSNGLSSLMKKPEFRESSKIIPIMQALEDDAMLMQIVDSPAETDELPFVHIGSENNADDFRGVSVVAHKYGRGDAAGVVAVIGPTRMDYSKVIKAVRIASAALQDE